MFYIGIQVMERVTHPFGEIQILSRRPFPDICSSATITVPSGTPFDAAILQSPSSKQAVDIRQLFYR
jgi:hypothetical protein